MLLKDIQYLTEGTHALHDKKQPIIDEGDFKITNSEEKEELETYLTKQIDKFKE